MTTELREPIAIALLDVIAKAYQWNTKPSRRVKIWDEVPADQRPACFLQEQGEARVSLSLTLTTRTLKFRLLVYTNAKPVDPDKPGATELNRIIDALDAAFAPSAADRLSGRKTLGAVAVQQCQIIGEILIDGGDLDGDGIAIIPINVLLP